MRHRSTKFRNRCIALAMVVAGAAASPLLLQSADAAASVTLPPTAAAWDYQIGAPYTPASDVKIVSRDYTAQPAEGLYNICYINAFQTQPADLADWPAELVLRDANGAIVEDPEWEDEYMLDIRTPAKRTAILNKIKPWIDQCASKGFDAVEPDNYDHYTRSHDLINTDQSKEFMKLLVDYSHSKNLAIAQKNTLELAGDADALGIDFAVVEECGVIWPGASKPECPEYYAAFGSRIVNVEYTDAGMKRACDGFAGKFSIVQRDVKVTAGGTRKTCPGSGGGGSTPTPKPSTPTSAPADTSAPTAPSGLSATGATSNSVTLSWTRSTDNVAVTGYDVFRNGAKVGSATGTTYTDAGLTAGTTYQYQVKAKDAAGNTSGASNTVSKATQSSGSGGGNGGGSNGCSATLVVTDSWSGAFDAQVSVKNTGSSATRGWKVSWTWPGTQKITGFWDAKVTTSGKAVTAANESWNAAISANATKKFDFTATGSVPTPLPTPTCTVS
ncbi:endo alpha-1,4 polygalactosaminidase [Streptomyces sp. NPDC058417]|uniref:endo alpha-1,4 polygalactosaminidase n=1 Tax=unclassified Streptomyces TaxID=2593676 RepID=UPI0036689B14